MNIKHESPIRPFWDLWFSNAGSTHFIIFMLSEMSVWADVRLLIHVSGVWQILYILIKTFGIDQKPENTDSGHESWIHKENFHYIEECQFHPQRIRHTVKWGSLVPPHTNLCTIPLFYSQTCIIHRMLDILEAGHISQKLISKHVSMDHQLWFSAFADATSTQLTYKTSLNIELGTRFSDVMNKQMAYYDELLLLLRKPS